MTLPHSSVLTQVLSEAADIANATNQPITSGHVLLALFTVANPAERMLKERGIDEDVLLDVSDGTLSEPPDALKQVLNKAEQIAAGCGATEADCMHVLYAMTRERTCSALKLLDGSGQSVSTLRQRALGVLTGAMPVWLTDQDREVQSQVSRTRPSPRSQKPMRAQKPMRSGLPRPGMSSAIRWSPPLVEPQRKKRRSEAAPKRRHQTVEPTPVESTISSLPPMEFSRSEYDDSTTSPWCLDPTDFPWLTSLGRNLSAEAAEGRLDPVIGREKEIDTLIDILGSRRTNNPCLLGEPGVGKTAVVEGLAAQIMEAPPTASLGNSIVIELNVGALLIGTHLRGSFSEKLQGIKEEVRRAKRVIIFFDELHTLVGAGATGDGAQDAATELKAALARGEFPCIGATTTDEWKKFIEPDPALERRFYPVLIKEPSVAEATTMLQRIVKDYADHHRVVYEADAVTAAAQLSARYITERRLPDKAIALLDLAGSRAARAGRRRVDRAAIGALVAEQAEIPVERVLHTDQERMLRLEQHLSSELVGHHDELKRIADVIRRNAAGFSSDRPQGSFLLLGPTGVGKTETAKVLAKHLHGSETSLIRFDLSEFSESHSVARLVGAPPGYVGYDAGGQLTDMVRKRPARVILLDEIEKAHRDVLLLFLQVLDDGRLTDSHGRTVSFAEAIIIMTSNLGADLQTMGRRIGFDADGASGNAFKDRVMGFARTQLAPELWARIEERLVFQPLNEEEICEVTRRLATRSSERLSRERGIRYALDDDAIDYLVRQGGYDAKLGARPMRQILSRIVEAPIAARILEGRLHADERVLVRTTQSGGLAFVVEGEGVTLSQRPTRAERRNN